MIHSSALDALVSLFEVLWRAAVPLPTSESRAGDENAARQTQMLALLMAGFTDEAIARQVGGQLADGATTHSQDLRRAGLVTRFPGWDQTWPSSPPRREPLTAKAIVSPGDALCANRSVPGVVLGSVQV